jgi:hypothetical protein
VWYDECCDSDGRIFHRTDGEIHHVCLECYRLSQEPHTLGYYFVHGKKEKSQ